MTEQNINRMQIFEISSEEYGNIVGDEVACFCKKEFLELNARKVDKIHYLVGKDSKRRFALAIGEKDREWRAPFSAPFADIIYLKKDISMEQLYAFIAGLNSYAKDCGAKSVNFFLPANIYCEQLNARLMNAFIGNGYQILYEDVNYSFDLESIDIDLYPTDISHMGRKNLQIGMNSGLNLHHCNNYAEKEEAYDVIKINRESRGFPLRMSKQQVLDTITIVDHDLFLLKKDDVSVASAVVYRVTKDIAQVIYWGNIPDVGEYKPINYLAFELIKFYKHLNFKILDIGPSTEEGVPNFGLCTFKESIGCIPSVKFRFQIEFSHLLES